MNRDFLSGNCNGKVRGDVLLVRASLIAGNIHLDISLSRRLQRLCQRVMERIFIGRILAHIRNRTNQLKRNGIANAVVGNIVILLAVITGRIGRFAVFLNLFLNRRIIRLGLEDHFTCNFHNKLRICIMLIIITIICIFNQIVTSRNILRSSTVYGSKLLAFQVHIFFNDSQLLAIRFCSDSRNVIQHSLGHTIALRNSCVTVGTIFAPLDIRQNLGTIVLAQSTGKNLIHFIIVSVVGCRN